MHCRVETRERILSAGSGFDFEWYASCRDPGGERSKRMLIVCPLLMVDSAAWCEGLISDSINRTNSVVMFPPTNAKPQKSRIT